MGTKEVRKTYNKIAEEYHNTRTKKHPQGWFFNELLEMPTTLKLLGNIKGKKVLDLGCGTGIYAKELTKRKAKVKGIDISNKEIEIARKENPKIEFKIGNVEKLPYKNNEFDIVLSALVLEYFKDWDKVLKEVKRVLKKGGYFIFSSGNPVSESRKAIISKKKKFYVLDNYFNERKIYGVWNVEGKKVKIPAYHKTYETIIKTILRNGFEIVDYKDCYPIKKAKKVFPGFYKEYTNVPFFCVWKVRLR